MGTWTTVYQRHQLTRFRPFGPPCIHNSTVMLAPRSLSLAAHVISTTSTPSVLTSSSWQGSAFQFVGPLQSSVDLETTSSSSTGVGTDKAVDGRGTSSPSDRVPSTSGSGPPGDGRDEFAANFGGKQSIGIASHGVEQQQTHQYILGECKMHSCMVPCTTGTDSGIAVNSSRCTSALWWSLYSWYSHRPLLPNSTVAGFSFQFWHFPRYLYLQPCEGHTYTLPWLWPSSLQLNLNKHGLGVSHCCSPCLVVCVFCAAEAVIALREDLPCLFERDPRFHIFRDDLTFR